MPREKRAAQFAPFDALKGFYDELMEREYEQNKEEKMEQSEEDIASLTQTILSCKKDDELFVSYYDESDMHYHTICGNAKILTAERIVEIYQNRRKIMSISFDDIQKIEIKKTL